VKNTIIRSITLAARNRWSAFTATYRAATVMERVFHCVFQQPPRALIGGRFAFR